NSGRQRQRRKHGSKKKGTDRTEPYHSTFTPSCSCRGSYVPAKLPNAAFDRLRFGVGFVPPWNVKFDRFSTLNASSRSSRDAAPTRATRLETARSTCANAGPRSALRGALPNGWLGSVGITKASLLNQFCGVCWPAAGYGSPTRFGR